MSTVVLPLPNWPVSPTFLLRQFTVDEYHQMIRTGILGEDEPVELIEGWIVKKMPRNPPHDLALEKSDAAIRRRLGAGWRIRIHSAMTSDDSEPEPDIALVRGPIPPAAVSHPRPPEISLLVEIADSSLEHDRIVKGRTYARAAVPIYWIVNLSDRQVEIYTHSTGPIPLPTYQTRRDYRETESVPLELDGQLVGHIPVCELLP